MVWKKKEEEDRGGERRENWAAARLAGTRTTGGQGRDVQLATFFISASKPKRRWGDAEREGGLLSLVCAWRARRERSRRRREQRGIPVSGCQWWRGAWLGQRVVPRKGDAEWERTGHGGTDKGSDAGSDGIHDRTQHVKRCSPRNGGSGSSSTTTTTTILSMKLPFPCFANNAHLSLCRERDRERERESEGGRQQDWLVRYGRSSG